jgi:type IV pilus assembly protein PilW
VAAPGQAYLQASFCPTDPAAFVFDTNAAAFTLLTKACNAAIPAELRQAVVRIFYLATCDVCTGAGDGVPTLKMAELSAGAFQVSALAQGIQDMHLAYGVDLDNNGSADCYVADPGTDNSASCTSVTYDWTNALNNWKNVTAVRINVLARNQRRSLGWTDSRTYDLGRPQPAGPFNDGYKRHVYAQVARIANVAGPRE